MTRLKELLTDHRETLQLAYGIFLIILIPALIAINAISLMKRYNDGMDAALQRNALATGRTIYAELEDDLGNDGLIQKKIRLIASRNKELKNIEVLLPEGNAFKIIASSKEENIGKTVDFYSYHFAWIQPDNDGIATDSFDAGSAAEGQDLSLSYDTDERFWLVAMPMQDASGIRQAILSLQISSQVVDDLTARNRNESLFALALTVIIVIFFLTVTVRLWDYVILYKKTKEIDRMKDEFISIASHELRTPLTSIKGYTSLILEGDYGKIENEKMRQGLDRIMSSTQRLEALVEDLLNVSRIEQGRLPVDIKDIRIEPLIEEIMSQLAIAAEEKDLELLFDRPAGSLPLVHADADRIKQVLINLIGNAIKYTGAGKVTVSCEIKDDRIRIKVDDTGIGISPEAQKNLFQKFYRVKTEKTEAIQGTGLGLWITKQIVQLMDGDIFLESIEGQGTQVTVVLPLADTVKQA